MSPGGEESSDYEFDVGVELLNTARARAHQRAESIDEIIVDALRFFVEPASSTTNHATEAAKVLSKADPPIGESLHQPGTGEALA